MFAKCHNDSAANKNERIVGSVVKRETAHDNATGATRSRRFFECRIANGDNERGGSRHADYRLALCLVTREH